MVGAALVLPVPVLAGDWPDPSVVRGDDGYVAVTTSGGWSPSFRILRSSDLTSWRIAGSVFKRPPAWAKTKFWAPELGRLGRRYAIFYSALSRRPRSGYCLGVATAPSAAGPYRDIGRPLRCGRLGSIDPFPIRDELGRLHLLWKQDGNRFGLPTPIYAQRLSEDGRRLLGRPQEILRNTEPWEGRVVEAPSVARLGRYFYLFYSANLCCTPRCAYAIGVARSPTLLGPWQKHPGNPILRGGNGWLCPGHPSLAPNGEGGLKVFFHAYRSGAGVLAGRQLLADDVVIGPDEWPRIGTGVPSLPVAGAPAPDFEDSFTGPWLAYDWEWPTERIPRFRLRNGLRLTAGLKTGRRVDAGVLGRRVGTDRFVATAVALRRPLRRRELAGLASYGGGFEGIGAAVGRDRLVLWQRRRGRYEVLAEAAPPGSDVVYLRMTQHARIVSFAASGDGVTWQALGGEMVTPVEESARIALTAGGRRQAVARFAHVSLRGEPEPERR